MGVAQDRIAARVTATTRTHESNLLLLPGGYPPPLFFLRMVVDQTDLPHASPSTLKETWTWTWTSTWTWTDPWPELYRGSPQ